LLEYIGAPEKDAVYPFPERSFQVVPDPEYEDTFPASQCIKGEPVYPALAEVMATKWGARRSMVKTATRALIGKF
jgi:hypothetical protein